MCRTAAALVALTLIGCGGATPVPSPTIAVSPTPDVSATNAAAQATITRGTEIAQLATSQAESVQIATLTAILAAPPPATPTALTPSTQAPVPTSTSTVVPPPTIPTSPPPPTPSGPQVVTVQGRDPLNVRLLPDPSAAVIALIGAGADVLVLEQDVIGADRTIHWVHVRVGDRDGYVRAEFVNAAHPSAGPIPTPIFLATRVPPAPPPPTATTDPNGAIARAGTTLSIAVHGDLRDNIPPDRYDQNKPGYRFAAVDVTLENISATKVSYSALFASLKTKDDRKYGTVIWVGDLQPTINGGTLQPGERERGWLVFEVPKGSLIVEFDYDDFSQRISFGINPP